MLLVDLLPTDIKLIKVEEILVRHVKVSCISNIEPQTGFVN